VRALRREDPPALQAEVVGVAALVPQAIGERRRARVALVARARLGQALAEHRRVIVGVDQQ